MNLKLGDLCNFCLVRNDLTKKDYGLCIVLKKRTYGTMTYIVWLVNEGREFEYAKLRELSLVL